MTYKATKIEAGEYEYRGIRVRRDAKIPAGYWGAWTGRVLKSLGDSSHGSHVRHFDAGSLRGIKRDIDNYRNEVTK